MNQHVSVLIIGGGQAGLAMSWRLRQAEVSHLVLDASAHIGDSWRHRYDSLTLFTPRHLSSLPGMPLPGDPDGYATRSEFADYLQAYAEVNELPVVKGTRVTGLKRSGAAFVASTDNGKEVSAKAVVVCTGAFQEPIVPGVASGFSTRVKELTTGNYRNPLSVSRGTVLVVGDGASGRDIAMDLTTSHRVLLATGKHRRLFPEKVLGQSTWSWMDRLGLLSASAKSPLGTVMRGADPFPDRGRSLKALRGHGIEVFPRLTEGKDSIAFFENGRAMSIDTVIWAVGYRADDTWIDVPEDTTGLFYLGRPWQRNRASSLIIGATRDSGVVTEAVEKFLSPQ